MADAAAEEAGAAVAADGPAAGAEPAFMVSRRDRLLRGLLHTAFRFTRGLTMGASALVVDEAERVLLVRHGYVDGWFLPGGGVEAGETVRRALERELMEEVGLTLTGEPQFLGLYHNLRVSRRDHVACFLVRAYDRPAVPAPTWEIREQAFFDRRALPSGTTPAVARRLAEAFDGAAKSDLW